MHRTHAWKNKGIKNSKVSLNERSAIVEYDPVITTTSDIMKTVNDLGYIATLRCSAEFISVSN